MDKIIDPSNRTKDDTVDAERALDTSDTSLLRNLTIEISKIATQAGAMAVRTQMRPHSTQLKHENEGAAYLTDASNSVLQYLRSAVAEIDPLNGFWEDGVSERIPGNRYWSLCPIDGTINYQRNLNEWTITIAILEINERGAAYPVLGVVYAPALGLMYLAARGEGAIRVRHTQQDEEKREAVIPSATEHLDGSVVCFGVSYFPQESKQALEIVASMAGHPADIKRIGPASLDLCKVADGTYDAYFEPRLHSWDVPAVAAATVVVWESKGTLERWDGSEIDWTSDNDLVATNGLIRDEIIGYLQPDSADTDAEQ
ncbi:MAG: inositol monophosphatase family protein [Bifidobacteriaceae bacterium]|nr:inositol monophosphatase family protein [Bifidobacteriaceae bacterium]